MNEMAFRNEIYKSNSDILLLYNNSCAFDTLHTEYILLYFAYVPKYNASVGRLNLDFFLEVYWMRHSYIYCKSLV